MDDLPKQEEVPLVELRVTRVCGVSVSVVLGIDPLSMRNTLERLALGEDPAPVLIQFLGTCAIKRLEFDTDQKPKTIPRPNGIALPMGVDPKSLRG